MLKLYVSKWQDHIIIKIRKTSFWLLVSALHIILEIIVCVKSVCLCFCAGRRLRNSTLSKSLQHCSNGRLKPSELRSRRRSSMSVHFLSCLVKQSSKFDALWLLVLHFCFYVDSSWGLDLFPKCKDVMEKEAAHKNCKNIMSVKAGKVPQNISGKVTSNLMLKGFHSSKLNILL